jgi:hypothetical protein
MDKPASLRAALVAAVPHLKANPDKLHVFVPDGNIFATAANSLSFEYSDYTLEILITDFPEPSERVIVPILAWLKVNQPDMLLNRERMRDGFKFQAEFLNNKTSDLLIKLRLTERVVVAVDGNGQLMATPQAEPPIDPDEGIDWLGFFIRDVVEDTPDNVLLTGRLEHEYLSTDVNDYLRRE